MKKFLFAALITATSAAQASNRINLVDVNLFGMRMGQTVVETTFKVDSDARDASALVTVYDEQVTYVRHCTGSGRVPGNCRRVPRTTRHTIFQDLVKIENLMLVDNKLIYQGVEGEVECGTMGLSRLRRIPTLFLSGKCELEGQVLLQPKGRRVIVNFTTI
jgi:hypothetical protein